ASLVSRPGWHVAPWRPSLCSASGPGGVLAPAVAPAGFGRISRQPSLSRGSRTSNRLPIVLGCWSGRRFARLRAPNKSFKPNPPSYAVDPDGARLHLASETGRGGSA